MEFLKKIYALILLIRPKNLIIVGATQWILYYFLLNKAYFSHYLSNFEQYLLIIDTMIIAAAGYVINDIKDVQSDLTNKPSKTFIPRLISIHLAINYYYMLIISGLLIAIYIAYFSDNLQLLFIYPLATLLLFLYSSKFKNSVLVGNVIVSIFTGMVSGIILVAEFPSINQIKNTQLHHYIIEIFLAFISFSFLANLIREIIKDLEDMDGDRLKHLKTLPLKHGKLFALQITSILIFLSTMGLIFWVFTTSVFLDFRVKCFILLFIAAPMMYLWQITQNKQASKKEFTKMSALLKWIMVAGLVSIILISNIQNL